MAAPLDVRDTTQGVGRGVLDFLGSPSYPSVRPVNLNPAVTMLLSGFLWG